MSAYLNLDRLKLFIDRLRKGESLLMLALGDSNTDNVHYSEGRKQWPEALHTALRQQYQTNGLLLVNAGICGDTVGLALERWESDVERFRPDLAIVCLGTNDALRSNDEAFASGLREISRRLEDMGCVTLLKTPPPMWQRDNGRDNIWREDDALKAKIAITRDLALERGLAFVDVYQLFVEMEDTGSLRFGDVMIDELHTNGRGHWLSARMLAAAFDAQAQLEPSPDSAG